uniref:Fibronectin type-III domain-containing protein n=1 Tax=Parascaris univalens TaxID=6257 RepID=A0A915A6D4_PARUN
RAHCAGMSGWHATLLVPFVLLVVGELPTPNVRNLRARFDNQLDAIFVEWSFEGNSEGVSYTVRYRLTNRQSEDSVWKYVRTTDNQARLNLAEVQNGDELQVQVQAERGGQVIEDWGQSLLISVTKRVLIGGVSVDDDDLLPPLDFTASILSPTSVRLEWTPSKENIEGLYYVVNVKQLTSETGGTLLRQQIKIEANNFALGNLMPGERYEMTIRTATSPERISSTAAIVEITMPREDEYFEVGNLVISSHFKSNGRGVVNLTWEVPPHIQRKIKSYDVQYAEAGSANWQRLQFSGQRPMATLTNLKSDTEYLLKIRTILQNDLATESGQFKFKTPEVVANPISKVDVIYSHDANMVRLQWILEPHVPAYLVVGYDVYLSEDKDLPESEWRHIHIDNIEGSLSLPDLKSATTYYVRVNVRQIDGTTIRAPSIYRFRTMERKESAMEVREPNSLAYRNIAPGQVTISWNYPYSISRSVTGSTILYTDRKDLSMDQWSRVDVPDPQQHSVLLSSLKPGTRYYVQIIPQINNERYDSNAIEMFEIRTDGVQGEAAMNLDEQYHPRSRNRPHMPSQPTPSYQELRVPDGRERLSIASCLPDAIK